MPYTELKRLADRYPKMVETKGGRTIFRAKRIIITSNISAESWYKQPFEELERRITSWFDYRRSDVPMYGLSFGSIFIELKKGDWKHHPLQDYLHQPDGCPDNIRYLDENSIREELDTDGEDFF